MTAVAHSAEHLLHAFAATRDDVTFRALYNAVTPAMFGFALRLTGGEYATAEDIVQDAWLRAAAKVDGFAAGGSVVRWLNGFVVNCWRERRRALMREVEWHVTDDVSASRDEPWSEAPVLAAAVNSLPDGYRTVLVMHDIEGYTHEEIARYLGVDAGTSKSQLARSRRRLRALLGSTRHDRSSMEGQK